MQCDKLKLMVNNILDFSKLEKGKQTLSLEMVNISQYMHSLINDINNNLINKNIHLTAKIPKKLPFMKIDRFYLEQAIKNLIDNAVKFSGKNKSIEVSTHCADGNLVISVKDNGIGIEKKELTKIFNQFYCIKNASVKARGSGLGLAIVKQVAQYHNGSIEVKSKLGQGSTFILKIPIYSGEINYGKRKNFNN